MLFFRISGRRVQLCEADSGTVHPGDSTAVEAGDSLRAPAGAAYAFAATETATIIQAAARILTEG